MNSVYDSEWYHFGEIFGHDAHYVDVDGGVDVGNSLQSKVYFGGNTTNDRIEGSLLGKNDFLYGMGGNDAIYGQGGDDYIEGGLGQDYLDGGAGNDIFWIQGTDADYDTFMGGSEEDTIQGSTGDDTIRVHNFTSANSIEKIIGGGGTDVIAGTEGGDIIDLSGVTTMSGIARIEGGEGNDTIKGTSGNDVIYGNTKDAGDDKVQDRLEGGAGSDTYYAGAGDVIYDSDGQGTIYLGNVKVSGLTFTGTSQSGVYKLNDKLQAFYNWRSKYGAWMLL